MRRVLSWGLCVVALGACKKSAPDAPATSDAKKTVGLVTDVGGRGDQSFNDSALRGLEVWAAGARFKSGVDEPVPQRERDESIPPELKEKIQLLPVKALVVESKAQEDYEPNLQLLNDSGADLVIGTGFMLENAVEAAAKENPKSHFLLIDSPILDSKGQPYALPNVRTVVFREEEGSFLVGAIAAQVAQGCIGFVGGMEIPLIKKFEAGFKAGVRAVKPDQRVLAAYTGSFDNVSAGKQVGQDLLAKGCDVVFQAAGSDGLGVIQAVKEARAAGKNVYAIGVDSDQWPVAPGAVLTSMLKRVDLAVYEASQDVAGGKFTAGDSAMGLKESGVSYAPIRIELKNKDEIVKRVEELRAKVVSGELKVPSTLAELDAQP
jgi:basic membrane protein A